MKKVSLLCMVLLLVGMSILGMGSKKNDDISVIEYKNSFKERCIEAVIGKIFDEKCSLMKFAVKGTLHYFEGVDADPKNSSTIRSILKKAIQKYEEKLTS